MEREEHADGDEVSAGARTEVESATADTHAPLQGCLEPGADLGGRYRIWSRVGAGGMGEVWRAFDLKLQVEVALKTLRGDAMTSERHLEALRQEVRAARQVVSPNVCRIYQLEEMDGLELVSMEFVDGQTLLEVLKERGPLELPEAQNITSQFLAGLEAIHVAGFIHRDIKPENIMVTRAGRVVVMDFGLARHETDPSRSASGTPAYMAPEQVSGEQLDARADVYAAGVVLAEMVSPGGAKDLESRKSLWDRMRSEPPELPDSPWAPVIRRAVLKDREQRYNTAHTLTRALEEVTLRVAGAEDLTPYPGLASFTEADTERFFGREAEVERMWRKLEGTPRLLGLVGPSGAGKTSFLRAGLIPGAGPGWQILRCTPGGAPTRSLRQELVSELAGDAEGLRGLVDADDAEATVSAVSRWRRRNEHALLIVDQFEELFTQSDADVQRRFTELLARIVLEADAFVLLSMRDDFLFRCHEREALRPLASGLTFLGSPAGGDLRRAIVQPAMQCGYRLEDDELVEEMLAEVEGERGALPLLAFAMARLWEQRDRQEGLLTRRACHDMGGVGGALARHAEETIDSVGLQRLPIVRELFRNLVTAEGTRAVREWDELLSVFEDTQREVADHVLRELIDARLVTSYEVHDQDGEPARRVEIVHESLLAGWPRLVRWQTQDADSARLRDELRQAARTWDEHGRSDDLLWTGAAYRELRLWRERYPGGLSEVEEAFAAAMTSLAGRRRRGRRIAAAAVLTVLVAVGAITTTLWRRGVAETRRAEAGKLLALGQALLEDDPTAALAYARASLEQADTPEARRFAVEVLWSGPIARILPIRVMAVEAGTPLERFGLGRRALSPDGRWLAAVVGSDRQILLYPADGGPPRALPRLPDGNVRVLAFGPRGDVLVTGGSGSSMRFWSLPELEEIRSVEVGGRGSRGVVRGGQLLTYTQVDDAGRDWLWRVWPLPDGEPKIVKNRPFPWNVDSGLTVVAYGRDRTVLLSPLEPPSDSKERVIGEAGDLVRDLAVAPRGDRVATLDASGQIRVWSTAAGDAGPLHVFQGPRYQDTCTWFDPTGRYVTQAGPQNSFLLWDLDSPPGTEPRLVRRRVPSSGSRCAFGAEGHWLVTSIGQDVLEFWSLGSPWARSFRDISSTIWSLEFTDDLRWLATCPIFQRAQLWPLNAASGRSPRFLVDTEGCTDVKVPPARDEILVGTGRGEVLISPISGGPPRRLPGGFVGTGMGANVDVDPEGRRALATPFAWGGGIADPAGRALRVWDLETGQEQVHPVAQLTEPDWPGGFGEGFARGGSLYLALGSGGRLMRLTLPVDPGAEISAETVLSAGQSIPIVSRDGRFLAVHARDSSETESALSFRFEQLLLYDLVAGTSRRITTHGNRLTKISRIDPSGRILVTGDIDGVVRAGPVTGEAPHLLLGHESFITGLAISPNGRWIASASEDSVRLWPIPDVTRPPLHTLPHDELLAKLDTLTNLRAVRDSGSSTGWTLEIGPFPGWETVPEW